MRGSLDDHHATTERVLEAFKTKLVDIVGSSSPLLQAGDTQVQNFIDVVRKRLNEQRKAVAHELLGRH